MKKAREGMALMPPAFFRIIGEKGFADLCRRNGRLTRREIDLVWRLTDRQGPKPLTLQLLVSRSDLERWLKTVKRARESS